MTVTLSIGHGSGQIVRRAGVALFGPSGIDGAMRGRFRDAPSDADAIAEVKRFLVERSFKASPLVIVSWSAGECDILLFGEVELTTSLPAAPMFSGAGSTTWIERHLGSLEFESAMRLQLWVGTEADENTDLERGTMAAGGFQLTMTVADDNAHHDLDTVLPPPEQAEPEPAEPEPAGPAPATPAPRAVADPFAPVTEPIAGTPEPATTPSATADVGDRFDVSSETEPPSVRSQDPFGGSPTSARDPGHTEPSAATARLVEAAVCGQGHANAPRSPSCAVCAEALSLDSSLRLIEQPVIGTLVFSDGRTVPAKGTVVIGRRPTVAGADEAVVVDQAEVSRSHVSVVVDGWTVLLTDLGSVNGTYVTTAADHAPVQLDANVPHVLEVGTSVHVGGAETAFTYVASTDALP